MRKNRITLKDLLKRGQLKLNEKFGICSSVDLPDIAEKGGQISVSPKDITFLVQIHKLGKSIISDFYPSKPLTEIVLENCDFDIPTLSNLESTNIYFKNNLYRIHKYPFDYNKEKSSKTRVLVEYQS